MENNPGSQSPFFGNTISGRQAGWAITGAVVGNTIIAKALGTKWLEALDIGIVTAGLGITVAGGLTAINGITEENVTKLAAGGALTGLGLFYMLPMGK